MQLSRPKYPKHKTVMVINDIPVKIEEETGDRFSAISNMNLLTSLTSGRVYPGNPIPDYKGVSPLDMYGTYLDYSYFAEGNYDFKNDFLKRKDLEHEGEVFYKKGTIEKFIKLEHQNDVYVSERLWNEFQGLLVEIKEVKPELIVVTGKWGLFFLTGCTTIGQNMGNYKDRKPFGGLAKFRSSIMAPHKHYESLKYIPKEYEEQHPGGPISFFEYFPPVIIPIYHTINAVSMPDKVPIMELDLQKIGWIYWDIKDRGIEKYHTNPEKIYKYSLDFDEVMDELSYFYEKIKEKPTFVSLDVETMFKSTIDCIGIAIDKNYGFCIPFCAVGKPNLWTLEEETRILFFLKTIMEHENCLHVGQNYSYDCQYYFKLWGINVRPKHDTMILHHILYNYLTKDLAFLASLYCENYCYWKDEIEAHQETPETRWIYNAKDVCYTLEILEVILDILDSRETKLEELYDFQMNALHPILQNRMYKGVRINKELKEKYYVFFSEILKNIQVKINESLGFEFNPNSSPQKQKLFKDFFGMTLKRKKGGGETCDAAAMLDYLEEYPLYKPFLSLLLEQSSLKVFTNNFLGMELDEDGRARTQYKISGTKTGRLSSTKNAFGRGGNFQNLPEKGKIKLNYAVQDVEVEDEDSSISSLSYEGNILLPNIKKIFIPDEGMEMADADYSGADIMVVAADSECKWLLDYLTNPNNTMKVYKYISSMFFQREITDEEYKQQKAIYHGLNYRLQVKKLSAMAGVSEYIAQQLRDFYFSLNPEVLVWQNRIIHQARTKGFISNIFGREAWFIDKRDPTLDNKICAFIPQSTIGDLINHAIVQIMEKSKDIETLLQVHDSGVFQYPISKAEECRKIILENMVVDLPYNPILRIPADIKVSRISYGDCKKIKYG